MLVMWLLLDLLSCSSFFVIRTEEDVEGKALNNALPLRGHPKSRPRRTVTSSTRPIASKSISERTGLDT